VTEHLVVVGASLAGLRAAETFRSGGYDGQISVIGAEPHLPYDRPPLSKKLLSGEWEPDRIELRKPDAYSALGLNFLLGRRAALLDPASRVLQLDDGERVPYSGLVIATGAHCRRLPEQPDLEGIFTLRTLDDALALRAALQNGSPKVVVIGAGFIGAEVAGTARQLGCEVTIVEALPVPLVRGLGEQMGHACAAVHGDHGVHMRLGVGVDRVVGSTRVESVHLADGTVLEADVVVVGIGVVPSTGWLEGSGLELRDGVVCDAHLHTGAPRVFAAGDVARWPNALYGEEMRVEHWTNASEQGALAAQNLLAAQRGEELRAYAPVPFFWSDQYDRRIQFLGRAGANDTIEVVAGSVEDRSFVALYSNGERLRAVLGMNQPKAVMSLRKLLEAGGSIADARAQLAPKG
jgi:NADPH-dependent 2,4-dienoyl-CoA reductase/sulfur reductase-like enzyme